MAKTFKEKSLWEKYKELIGIREEPTEEQKAEFERVKAEMEAQGLHTGEAAPITGEDLADFITTFGAGGALKLGTKTVGRSKLAREAGEQVLEVGEQVGKQVGKKTINLLNKVDKEVEKFSKETVKHLAKKYKTTGDISIRVGSKGGVGVSQTFKPNGKNMKLLDRIGNKIFSKNTIKYLGGPAAIGSIMLSIWARAEATESMSYAVMKPAMDRGTFKGDWSIYNEAVAARDEILDQNILEKIGNFMPIWGAIQNIYLPGGKADAIKTAFEFQDRLATAGMEEELTPEEIQNKSREELIREQLDTETNPTRRIQLMEDLEFIERAEDSWMVNGKKQQMPEDPEERKAVLLAESERKKRLKRKQQQAEQQKRTGKGFQRTEQSETSARRETQPKVGFGLL